MEAHLTTNDTDNSPTPNEIFSDSDLADDYDTESLYDSDVEGDKEKDNETETALETIQNQIFDIRTKISDYENILLNKFIKYQKEFVLPELIIKNKSSYLKNHMNIKNNYCYYEKYERIFYLSNSSKCD